MKVNAKHAFLLVLAAISLFLGILFLVNSTSWGYESAVTYREIRGGILTDEFNMIIRSKIESFKYLGIIFTSLGGLSVPFIILSKDFWARENSAR